MTELFLKKENIRQFLMEFNLDGFYCISTNTSLSFSNGTEEYTGKYRKFCDEYPYPGLSQTTIKYLTDLGFNYAITARVNPDWKVWDDDPASDSFPFLAPKKIMIELQIVKKYKD